jgi:hypothetical protein
MHKPDIGESGFVEREALDEGVYECFIRSYEVVKNRFYHDTEYVTDKDVVRGNKPYKKGDTVPADPSYMEFNYRFVFEVCDGPHAGRWFFGKTGTTLTKGDRNGLRKLLSKVLGADGLDARIDAKDAPDFDTEVVGLPIKVVVDKVKSKTEAGKFFNNVTGYMKSEKEIITWEDDE